jgi:hypothetical protein
MSLFYVNYQIDLTGISNVIFYKCFSNRSSYYFNIIIQMFILIIHLDFVCLCEVSDLEFVRHELLPSITFKASEIIQPCLDKDKHSS